LITSRKALSAISDVLETFDLEFFKKIAPCKKKKVSWLQKNKI
jgi:hypothetical protein